MGKDAARVAFDVTPLALLRTGIGHAVGETFDALAHLTHPPELIPYAFGASLLRNRGDIPRRTRLIPLPARALLWAWSRAGRPRLDVRLRPAQVIHATHFVAPPSGLPVLTTVHDCAFARMPDVVSPTARAFGPILRRAVAAGGWLHCTTESVAAEADELFGPGLRRAGRLVVVPFGVPDLSRAGPLPRMAASRLPAGAPYVLALGMLEPRKNLPRLVRAFGGIAGRHRSLRLVLAGPEGADEPAVLAAISSLDSGVRDQVVLAGAVDDGARRTLIERASVLSYPSLYEGFGFPMLEAMTLGVPVVASDAGAIPEVAEGAAHLVDPLDQDSIGAGLDLLLTDEERRQELIARGKVRAGEFTWRKTAEGLSAAYRELAANPATS
jgi:glycosyltransferase involved in cell wall biosynthesis